MRNKVSGEDILMMSERPHTEQILLFRARLGQSLSQGWLLPAPTIIRFASLEYIANGQDLLI